MSEAKELQFLALGLRKAHAFELECLTHGTFRIFEAERQKEYGCPSCRAVCRTWGIRARVMTRRPLPVFDHVRGRTQLNVAWL